MEGLWDFGHTLAEDYLRQFEKPWQALAGIGGFIRELIATDGKAVLAMTEKNCGHCEERSDVAVRNAQGETDCHGLRSKPRNDRAYREVQPGVWVHETAKVAPSAVVMPPCIIGANTEIRTGAFLRGSVLVGDNCVVGNSVEIKNAILFDGVQVPHFNYVGDSILGYKAHFGAGAVTSNVRGDKGPVKVDGVDTGRKKVGAFVGDFGEIGCNAVLNPGTVIGRNSQVYPTACVRGVVPENSIYKADGSIVRKMQNA